MRTIPRAPSPNLKVPSSAKPRHNRVPFFATIGIGLRKRVTIRNIWSTFLADTVPAPRLTVRGSSDEVIQ